MLALASILSGFAAITCVYFQAAERGQTGKLPQSAASRMALRLAAIGGLAASFSLAVMAQGWPAGIGLWLAALMVSGVAAVSLAGTYWALTRRLGLGSAVAGVVVVLAHWVAA